MEKRIFLILSILSILYSCSDGKLKAERDVLLEEKEQQENIISSYITAMSLANSALDSMKLEEANLFNGENELPVTKEDVRQNLVKYEDMLKIQERKIEDLEKELTYSKQKHNEAKRLIENLRRELEGRSQTITQLKSELEKKNFDIEELKSIVQNQTITIQKHEATINELSRRAKKQDEALTKQDEMLNNGYILIGTKDDLKRKKVTKKGKLIADGVLDRSKFAKIDIREFREIEFSAKKPKILTNMPESSYELTTKGKGEFVLHIVTPADFWKITRYLVIQTD